MVIASKIRHNGAFKGKCSTMDPVFGQPVGDCRLAREMGECIYCFKFGTRKFKPKMLRQWKRPGVLPEFTLLLTGKENGNMYYSQASIDDSPTATAVPIRRVSYKVEMTSARFKSLLAATGRAMTNPALDKAVLTGNALKSHRMAISLSMTIQALV